MTPNRSALLADDDEFLRHALEAILQNQFGFSYVAKCRSFDDSLEALHATGHVELAVFDLNMPGLQNPHSLRVVRECFPDTVVVVLSASEERDDILQALEAGVHGYVGKRHGILKLTEALNFILKGYVVAPWLLSTVTHDRSPTDQATEKAGRFIGPAELTPRQRHVLELLVKGKSNKEIARTIGLGEGTVKVHMAALFRALGVNSRAAAAAFGAKHVL